MYYVYLLMSSAIAFIPFFNMLPVKLRKLQYLAIYLLILSVAIFLDPLDQASTYFSIGGSFLLIYIFSPFKWLNLCCAAGAYLFNIILNHITLNLLEIVFNITTTELYSDHILIFTFVYMLILFILTYILGWVLRSKIKLQNIKFSPKILIAVSICLILCASMFIFNFSYAERVGYPPEVVRINGILFSLYFFLNIIILIFTFQTQRKEKELEIQIEQRNQLTNYMQNLEHINKSMRAFKHDYLNILTTMRCYIMDNNIEGLRIFFDEQILKTTEDSTLEIGKLSNMLILEIKGLLYTKIIVANAKGIKVSVKIPYPVTHVSMDIIDLVRILGIFLDNAIEASENLEEKKMDIVIIQKDTVSIIIANTCPDLTIPISSINEMGVSSKGENRGYGLYNVSKLLQKYPKVRLYTNYGSNYFEQTLEYL